jgi:hypothetical protein
VVPGLIRRHNVGYGDEKASDQNLNFDFDGALDAARDCWALASQMRSYQNAVEHWNGAGGRQPDKVSSWSGPKRLQFDEKIRLLGADTSAIVAGLEVLARDFAGHWAKARGQQDRINRARWVDHQMADDNILEKAWQWFGGKTEHGDPPGDPDVPQPPQFEATRQPMFHEFLNP